MVFFDGRKCRICDRPARLYGLRNIENGLIGWCGMCQTHYRQNGIDWVMRCVCKPTMSHRYAHAAFSNRNIRKHILVFLVGSLASIEKYAQKEIWTAILYANGAQFVHNNGDVGEASDGDSEYDEYRQYVNPMWSLAAITSCGSDGPRLRVLDFLGDYQKKRRRV